MPPYGACLLGSVNLAKFVDNPFTPEASFNWTKYKNVVRVFTRMLDNVVELNGLPMKEQQEEIFRKRRHGMGFLGLGSALSLLGMTYGSPESVAFTEKVSKEMAIESYAEGISLASEKGPAPIMEEVFNGVSGKALWAESEFMKKIWNERPDLYELATKHGCRFTHATSIAPTGTISLSVNNNVSNGIEPSFSHHYVRNVIKEGKKSKEAVDVYSYEMLLYKSIFGTDQVPSTFSTSDTIGWKEHVDIQAAAQEWCDSSISKTINVPTDMDFETFKEVYLYAASQGLKGCTTFRMNPAAFQGVLVKQSELSKIQYVFTLETGEDLSLFGDELVSYDGETHTVANLFDALKEGYYGKF